MILTDIRLSGVRRFTSPVRLDGLGPGLNILALPNESGKSTVLLALRAALMWRHSSGGEHIKSLSSYGGSEPHIILRFMWDNMTCVLEKRFLKKKSARLILGHDQYQGDEAEEKIRELLGLTDLINKKSEAAGLWSALLVPQGESQYQPELTDAGYTSIRSCLDLGSGGGVAAGGGVASQLLLRIREKLGALQTEKKADPTGVYKQVLERKGQLEARLQQLKENQIRLEDDLTALAQERRTLRALENPTQREDDKKQLERVRQELDRVSQAALKQKEILTSVRLAQSDYDNLLAEQNRRKENQEHQRVLSVQSEVAHTALLLLREQTERALEACKKVSAQRQAASESYERSRRRHELVSRQCILTQEQDSLKADRVTLKRIEIATQEWQNAQAAFRACCVDQNMIDLLRKAQRNCDMLRLQMEAQAPAVSLTLLPEASERVRVDGRVCSDNVLKIIKETYIEIDGIGSLCITPAQQQGQEGTQARWSEACRQLEQILQKTRCRTVEEAEQAFDTYRQMKAERDAAQRTLLACMPENKQNIDQIAAFLGLYQAQTADKEEQLQQRMTSLEADKKELFSVEEDISTINSDAEVENSLRALKVMQEEEAQKEAFWKNLQTDESQKRVDASELSRAFERARQEEQKAQAVRTDAALEEEITSAVRALKEALSRKDAFEQEMAGEERSFSDLEGDITRREQALSAVEERIKKLHGEVRAREERVRQAEGEGLDEQIAETERLIEQSRLESQAYMRESAALSLLKQTVEAAEQEQTERYLAPLIKVMQPAFSTVFPDMKLSLGANFGVQAVTRRQTEQFSDLSMGTREQIAVLTRLGFAQLLYNRYGKSFLVLDDALSFSDRQRRERLFEVLTNAAKFFQIVILTCRDDVLSELGGQTLRLLPCTDMAELCLA